VQTIQALAHQWFTLASAGDAAGIEPLYHPNSRDKAPRELEQIGHMLKMAPGLSFDLMVVKFSDTEAEAVSKPFKIDHPEAPDQAVMILHLRKADGRWLVLYNSGDVLRSIPNNYDLFKRRHPDGTIWLDPAAPDWLKPDEPAGQGQPTVEAIFTDIPRAWPNQVVAEKLNDTIYDKAVFETWFPDDPNGYKALADLWSRRSSDPNAPEKILLSARGGLRSTLGKEAPYIISWLGNQFVWAAKAQNPQAIELMLYASYNRDLAGNAVYYGLSVIRPRKSPQVLQRLVALCMIDQSVGRILWGAKPQIDEMLPYLKPWLEHEDPDVRTRAAVLQRVFRGELDYDQYQRQQKLEHDKALIGDKLPLIRDIMATGPSPQRRKLFSEIKYRALSDLLDESFRPALIACLSDGHPEVRQAAIEFGRDILCKPGDTDPRMLEWMERLSKDSDSKVRNAVAVFTGSRWIWAQMPQDPRAVEIMMTLAKDSDHETRNNAVYYGLSVLTQKDPAAVQVLIDLALDPAADADIGRIAWGLARGADKGLIQSLLEPHLKAATPEGNLARELHKKIFAETAQRAGP